MALVGRNGSGKSTLLSLIGASTGKPPARLSCGEPSRPCWSWGPGSPRLTGRENVYLNGVILGLTRREVEKRFDAIVEFAETQEFLNTPVRNYSPGMLMRLGFAVACHTDAPILLVDEVLAPADEEFQEKCYRRIAEFQREGRTILFVSHDVEAVRRVAHRAVWLDHGRLRADGPLEPVIAAYQADAHHHEV